MNKWIVLSALFSTLSYASSELSSHDIQGQLFEVPEVISLEHQDRVCNSLVCSSVSAPKSVPVVGDFPERESNPTIDTIASAIYFVGEIGVAENLSTPEYEQFFEN
ncbi:hypothetical protein L1D22_00495 [Vibrio sp. Isolate34]|uniref:hypothetical protein n=1 Tax=Vibrio sp. Isolate34 TaxID=2908540 RepID=UPI001EFCE420|nr:hypothetical protein [Vibrio sp. Isolate34]MCG9638432.1 hypothetical protein [Vibrio sp. Isolate34]